MTHCPGIRERERDDITMTIMYMLVENFYISVAQQIHWGNEYTSYILFYFYFD